MLADWDGEEPFRARKQGMLAEYLGCIRPTIRTEFMDSLCKDELFKSAQC